MTIWYCDRCGNRLNKNETRCSRCYKIIYWQYDGHLFGSYFPKDIKAMTKFEAKEIQNKWDEYVKKKFRRKGLLHYIGYLIFGEGDNVDRRRRRATTEEMAEVFRRWGHKCDDCGSQYNLTVDHIIPLAKGGDWDIDNLRPLCHSCNSRKGARI